MEEPERWDIFISHASEDHGSVAAPLAHALRAMGVRVWLDAQELQVGDSIRRKIDHGLSNSRYGAVILSPRLFTKGWAQAELDALFGMNAVLPIWHEITEEQLRAHSPLLVAKKGVSTSAGIGPVATALADRVFAGQGVVSAPQSRAFATALANGDHARWRALVKGAIGVALHLGRHDRLVNDVMLGGEQIDVCASVFQPSAMRHEHWDVIFLGPAAQPAFDAASTPNAPQRSLALSELLGKAQRLRAWVRLNLQEARTVLPGLKIDFASTLVMGRRAQPGSAQAQLLADFNDSEVGYRLRTYDWLLNALMKDGSSDFSSRQE